MIKGIQRQMVELRTDRSQFFERAYFVLRDTASTVSDMGNIVEEANRIIAGTYDAGKKNTETDEDKRRTVTVRRRRRIALFVSGFLCGGGIAALFVFLVNAV